MRSPSSPRRNSPRSAMKCAGSWPTRSRSTTSSPMAPSALTLSPTRSSPRPRTSSASSGADPLPRYPATRRDRELGGYAGADLAGDAGPAEPAIAVRILGEILLVVVLGEIELGRVLDLGGDGPKPSRL